MSQQQFLNQHSRQYPPNMTVNRSIMNLRAPQGQARIPLSAIYSQPRAGPSRQMGPPRGPAYSHIAYRLNRSRDSQPRLRAQFSQQQLQYMQQQQQHPNSNVSSFPVNNATPSQMNMYHGPTATNSYPPRAPSPSEIRVTNVRGAVAMPTMRQAPAKRLSPQESAMNHQPNKQMRVSPMDSNKNNSANSILNVSDSSLAAAIGSAQASGLNSVRISNSITLSVCPPSEEVATSSSNNSLINQGGSPNSSVNIRGVTVTPASPPVASISPITPPATRSPKPIFQNAGEMMPPPLHSMRRADGSTVIVNSAERPNRPPTVDLTHEETTNERAQIALSAAASLGLTNGVGSRPVSCEHCSILFGSWQDLEKHKLTSNCRGMNGMGVRRGPIISSVRSMVEPVQRRPAIHNPQSVLRPQQNSFQPQQTMRAPAPPQNVNRNVAGPPASNYMYIPLLDLTRLDDAKIMKLDELGITSIVPLHEKNGLGSLGIPIMNLRQAVGNGSCPWDNVSIHICIEFWFNSLRMQKVFRVPYLLIIAYYYVYSFFHWDKLPGQERPHILAF